MVKGHASWIPEAFTRREFLGGVGALAAGAALAVPGKRAVAATDFPAGRPINFLIHAAPGGGTDVGLRILQPYLEKALNTQIVPMNHPTAGGHVMLTELSKSKPDGYTLGTIYLPGFNAMWLDPRRQPTYKRKDFSFLCSHVLDPGVIVVKPNARWKTLKEFTDEAKAKPASLSVALGGIVSDDHLFLLDVMSKTGTDIKTVHFNSTAPAHTAFLGGHTDALAANEAEVIPLIKRGEARILALANTQRSKYNPEIPTLREQGLDIVSYALRGYMMPANPPQPILEYLGQAFKEAITDPEHMAKMEKLGFPVVYMGSKEFTEMVLKEDARVARLVKQFGVFDPLPQN